MRIYKAMTFALSFLLTVICAQHIDAQATVTGGGEKLSTIRGVVIDDDDEPLPGATVMIVGRATSATSTNVNGEFTITAPKKTVTLKITYVGMKEQEVKATAGKYVTVRLETDAEMLKEAVANGIYTRNIESFTGSVSTFKGDDLKMIAPQGIIRSLSILDPSVVLADDILNGANPNKLADISINGKMNVQELQGEYEGNPNMPLFILDGFESNLQTITDLNMDRVESISILKDASATAIYGSKAANGVIVVETVKPQAGRLRLSYNGSLQVAWADLSDFNLMNSREKLQFELLAGVYDGSGANGSPIGLGPDGLPIDEQARRQYFNRLRLVESGRDTYWMNEPLRTAFTQNHNVYIDGGDQSFRYGAGLSYGKTEGVMKGSDRDVINGNITLTYRVDKFNFTNQTTINNTSANNETVAFSAFSQMNPFYSKVADTGEVPSYVYDTGSEKIWNPLWDLQQRSFNKSTTTGITDNFQFEWRATQQLRFRGNLQYQLNKTTNEKFVSPNETTYLKSGATNETKGEYVNTNSTMTSYSGRLNVTYGAAWDNHTFNAVGGMQFSQNQNKSNSFMARGYSSDLFSNPNFSNGYPQNGKPTSTDTKSRSVSYYANLNYAYDMRYLLDFNYSRSGASQFGIDDPFTDTWSVGVGWNMHNEHWFKFNKYISYLKLHASYGNPGNQNYDAKLASSIYIYNNKYYNPFGLSALISQWGNRGLKWQKTKTYNVGMTATMFNNHLNLNADYQIRKSEPQLVRIDLPSSTGTTSAPMNVGGTDNRSVSVSATVYIIRKGDFNWYISGNVNHNTTKYYGIGNTLEQYNEAGRASQSLMRMFDGASTTGLYVVRSAGIDPATGNEVYIRKDGTYTYEYNADDEILWGDTNPDFTGSLSTSFMYKGISFGASFSFRSGADTYLQTLMDKVENISSNALQYNQDRRALYDRWKKPGDIAKYKRIDDQSPSHKTSRFIAKEHTFSCASINIGYRTVTWPFLRTMGMTSFDIRAYMNDIFRISNIKEERGTSYPFQRSFSISLGLGF